MCVVEKIKKLLKLGESPNEFEAQRAIMKAQELACKNGIVIDDIDSKEEISSAITIKLTDKKRVQMYESQIAKVIADNFKVSIYKQQIFSGGYKLMVVGLPDDVEIFKEIYNFAITSFKKFRKRFLKTYREENCYRNYNETLVKNSYLFGFVEGLDNKFKENVMSHSLVITTPPAVISELEKLGLVLSKRRTIKTSRDESIKNQGFMDGRASAM